LGTGHTGNTFLAVCQRTREACIVDFSDGDVSRWARVVESLGIRVKLVLQTHFDKHSTLGIKHLHDVDAFEEARVVGFGALTSKPAPPPPPPPPVTAAHSKQRPRDLIRTGEDRTHRAPSVDVASTAAAAEHYADEVDVFVRDGDVVAVGDLRYQVIHTPGVSPEHVLYYEAAQGIVFTGDLIRPGSSPAVLDGHAHVRSLQRFVQLIPETTIILPNHTGLTTMGHERRSNPQLVDVPGPKLMVQRRPEKLLQHSKATKEEQPYPQTALPKSRRFYFWL